jgi:mannose/fructose/N-acetylgalactosamine-specific phosphotransferase system component IID
VDCDSKKYYSEWDSVTDGVPQGSILGPLLFLLYVNGIPNVISDISNPVLYADDTSLIITNSNSQMLEKNINTAILQLNRWFSSN